MVSSYRLVKYIYVLHHDHHPEIKAKFTCIHLQLAVCRYTRNLCARLWFITAIGTNSWYHILQHKNKLFTLQNCQVRLVYCPITWSEDENTFHCCTWQTAAVCQWTPFSSSTTRLFKELEAPSGDVGQPPAQLQSHNKNVHRLPLTCCSEVCCILMDRSSNNNNFSSYLGATIKSTIFMSKNGI